MAPAPDRCPACGYPHDAGTCGRCGGSVHSPRDGRPPRVGPGVPLRDLVGGFVGLFAAALALLHDREYVGKLTLPIIANLIALTVAVLGVFWGLWELFDWLIDAEHGDWGWFDFLRTPAAWTGGVLSLVLATISVWLVAPVLIETVTAPFLDPLAEATEAAWARRTMGAVSPGFWSSALVGVKASAQVLLLQLGLLIPLLLLSLTGFGALLAMVIAAWMNAVIWFDIPCARRGYGLRERRALLRRNWARAIGFGLAFQIGMFIPLFNLLLLTPAAAVATSAAYFRFDKRVAPAAKTA